MKFNKQFFGWFGASALLLTSATACSDKDSLNTEPQEVVAGKVYGNGSNIVTFTVEAEGAIATRDNNSSNLPKIGDGTKVDVLIFEVWKKGEDGKYHLAPEFASTNPNFEGSNIELGLGQNVIKATYDQYPLQIKLALDPEEKYRILLWAQNSSVTAFNTTSLRTVQVDYSKVPANNYEAFDSFSAVSNAINGSFEGTKHIVLTRPFAQINLGTTGADLNYIMSGKTMVPNKRFRYSKVALTGVADTYDVFTGKATTSEAGKDKRVEFGWEVIPAYSNIGMPKYNDSKKVETYTASLLGLLDNEEYLLVNLNGERHPDLEGITYIDGDGNEKQQNVKAVNGFYPYKTSYPTILDFSSSTLPTDPEDAIVNKNAIYLTEQFKYLSMCYVLVNSSPTEDFEDEADTDHYLATYTGSNLEKVELYLAEMNNGTDCYFYTENNKVNIGYYNAATYLSLNNVPVNHNWRTNILAGLHTSNNNYDPEDPTSVVKPMKVCVHLDPIFDGEYNGTSGPAFETDWTEINQETFPNGSDSWHDDFNQNMHEEEPADSDNGNEALLPVPQD